MRRLHRASPRHDLLHVRSFSIERAGLLPAAVITLGLSLGAVGGTLAAQGTAADYARAARLLPASFDTLVLNEEVRPHWLGETPRLWYRRELPSKGKEFVVVDARRGTKTAAFDHARLAAALSAAMDTSYAPTKLPFDSIDLARDLNSVTVNVKDARVRCDLSAYTCARIGAAPDPNTLLSPDGRWAAFLRDHDLWVRNTGTDEEVRLTHDGAEYDDYATSPESNTLGVTVRRLKLPRPPVALWSPDSRRLVTYRLDQRHVRTMHLLQFVPDSGYAAVPWSYRYPLPGDTAFARARLVVFDVAARSAIWVQAPPLSLPFVSPVELKDIWWSRDGTHVFLLRLGRGQKSLALESIDAGTGATRTLVRESGPTYVEATPTLGARPNVRVLADGTVLWYSERDGWGHLYRYAPDGTLRNEVGRGAWQVRSIEHVDARQGRILFTAGGREPGDPYDRRLYAVDVDGSHLRLLTPENGDHEVSVSPSGRWFVDTWSRPDTVPQTVLRRADGRRVATLESADVSRLLAAGWHWPEPFTVKAADDTTDLYGLIWRPSSYDPSRKYPVLDDIYPGPQTIRTPQRFGNGGVAAATAELGFIVVNIDGRGTPYRSKAFHDLSYGHLEQAGGLDDHVHGIRELAARDPSMDLDRVGIYGYSGGGYASTHAILAYPDFYKVAVSGAGNHDQRGYIALWGETYEGWPVDAATYALQANRRLAANLKGKLLLVHGDMDDNVSPALTFQLVDALIKANKDFDLLILPNRNHGSGAMDPYFLRRRWDYFVRNLLGVEPPAGFSLAPAAAR